MSARSDIAAIVRYCQTDFLDTRYDVHAEPGDIADELYAAVRAEVLAEQEKATATAATATPQVPVCPVCQKPGCCCRCFGKTPRSDCPHSEATPFFQPGHTYQSGPWVFDCATVTAHPASGLRAAIGWLQLADGSWTTYDYNAAEWDGWTDITGGHK